MSNSPLNRDLLCSTLRERREELEAEIFAVEILCREEEREPREEEREKLELYRKVIEAMYYIELHNSRCFSSTSAKH